MLKVSWALEQQCTENTLIKVRDNLMDNSGLISVLVLLDLSVSLKVIVLQWFESYKYPACTCKWGVLVTH